MSNSAGIDFARQLAERNAALNPVATKKFRSAPVPKGTKLRPGYQDRTQFRTSTEDDEKAKRVQALEDMVKLGQMEMATFEALRDEIVGGDVKNVHLVKGLDWKLLERVRQGEDVLAESVTLAKSDTLSQNHGGKPSTKSEAEIEEELERYESKDIQPTAKTNRIKKGEMAPPVPIVGRKRNRDEILKDLKASRAVSAKQPSLGPRFTKVGEPKEKSRIEKDQKGREVLIVVDEDGKVKRKVRKTKTQSEIANDERLLMPDKNAKPLGMEVLPVTRLEPQVSDDEDIFEGVGTEYNPLGDLDEDDEGDSDTEDNSKSELQDAPTKTSKQIDNDSSPVPESTLSKDLSSATIQPTSPQSSKPPRDYFKSSDAPSAPNQAGIPSPLDVSTLRAVLNKASVSNSTPLFMGTSEPEAAKLERRRKMLESHDRDADDMDMGFGESRFDDGEDGDEGKVKLSVWGQAGGDEEETKKGKRKRGGKKRKGDGNSAVDVLKVIERRKEEQRTGSKGA